MFPDYQKLCRGVFTRPALRLLSGVLPRLAFTVSAPSKPLFQRRILANWSIFPIDTNPFPQNICEPAPGDGVLPTRGNVPPGVQLGVQFIKSQAQADYEKNITEFAGVLANDHISFSLNQGEILGFLGESGAGKSTLVKAFRLYIMSQTTHISAR